MVNRIDSKLTFYLVVPPPELAGAVPEDWSDAEVLENIQRDRPGAVEGASTKQ